MAITSLRLKNFRCFENFKISFDKKFVVIEGQNGAGKTTILEALYFACYLKSFRTRLRREIVNFQGNHFFIQVNFKDEIGNNSIQIGYSDVDGRKVKFNDKPISSFREVISQYKVISLTQDDLQLITGSPEIRRAFMNQALFIKDPSSIEYLRNYKKILDQRNSFLLKNAHKKLSKNLMDELYTWTKQLWEQSKNILKLRIDFLNNLTKATNKLFKKYFLNSEEKIGISLDYIIKSNINYNNTFNSFWESYLNNLLFKEQKWMRSLFGIHLDDFSIVFKKKKARFFASRGQQKLILFLLKVVQLQLCQTNSDSGCFLIDDFFSDFDAKRLSRSILLLNDLPFQIFITSPLDLGNLTYLNNIDFSSIQLQKYNPSLS